MKTNTGITISINLSTLQHLRRKVNFPSGENLNIRLMYVRETESIVISIIVKSIPTLFIFIVTGSDAEKCKNDNDDSMNYINIEDDDNGKLKQKKQQQ